MEQLPYVSRYKGCLLRCTPEQIDESHFAPKLLIYRQRGSRPEEVAVPQTVYMTRRKAALAAYETGMHWIDEHLTS